MGSLAEYLSGTQGRLHLPEFAEAEQNLEAYYDALTNVVGKMAKVDSDEFEDYPNWGNAPVAVAFLADWHVGSRWVDYDHLKDFTKTLAEYREANPGALKIVFLGDGTDGYMPNMGRVSGGMFEEVEPNLDRQDALFVWLANRMGGMDYITMGCHWNWALAAGRDPLLHVAPAIGAKHSGQGIYIRATVGEQEYRIVGRHKSMGDSRLNTSNAHRRLFDEYEMPGHDDGRRPDIVARAHLHVNRLHREKRAGMDTIWLSAGGAKGSDNYARQLGVKHCSGPGEAGMPLVVLYPDSKRMVPFYGTDWVEGLTFLEVERRRLGVS
jgi:hypothetical protein